MPASGRWLSRLIVVCGVVVAACASTPKPTIIQAELKALPAVNPDARGRPSPIVIKLFELKSLAVFNSADFFSLFDHGRDTLSADLVAQEEYELAPGAGRKFERTLQADTRFIGVVAAYRDLEHSTWRAAVPVTPSQTTPITITLDANKVVIGSPH
jgi:type VI secretion system protein VasD